MPERSAISELPEELRKKLEARLVASNFSGYRDLAGWLQENGFEISKSAVHRYGSRLEENIARVKRATEMARVLTEEVGDDEGALTDATLRLAQQKFFDLLMDFDIDPSKVNPVKLTKALADLSRASVSQKKLMQEVRAKAHAAAEEVKKLAAEGGLSKNLADRMFEAVTGVAR